jgi:HEAT repeat protein
MTDTPNGARTTEVATPQPTDRLAALLAQLRDPKVGKRQAAVDELVLGGFTEAVPDFANMVRREPNANLRQAIVVGLRELDTDVAEVALIRVADADKQSFVRRAAIEALGEMGSRRLLQAYPEMIQRERDKGIRRSLATALSRLGDDAAQVLIQQRREAPADSDERPYLIHLLTKMLSPAVVDDVTVALTEEEMPEARKAAADVLHTMLGERAFALLAERLDRDNDPSVRKKLVTLLGQGRQPAIAPLVQVLVQDQAPEVRQAAQAALQAINDPEAKRRALLDALELGQKTRGEVDAIGLAQAIGGTTPSERQSLADFLIAQAPGKNDRMTEVFAELIVACCGGNLDVAGTRLNRLAGEDEVYRSLRIQIGGTLALDPILTALQQNLYQNFTAPIADLNKRTQDDWRSTIEAAHLGFRLRMWMSVLVFVVGMAVVITSASVFLFGGVSGDRLWGTGVTFAGGLGAMLAVVYSGPLREIRQSVADLGASSAAFIGFIHRILQASHTFSYYYLKSTITFLEAGESSDLISKALTDMRLGLDPGASNRDETPPDPTEPA